MVSGLRIGLFFSIVALAGLAACATETSSKEAGEGSADVTGKPDFAQMNDVSVLYPLASSAAEFKSGYLTPASVGAKGALLPAKLYTSATGEPKTAPPAGGVGSDRGLVYDELRMMAFRVDPCFANIGPITDPASCQNQLRIIFQPLSFDGKKASAVDGAFHAFYSLTRDELTTLVKGLIDLRQKQSKTANLGALAVHPVLSEQGLLGDAAKGMAALVLANAGEKNLVRFTELKPGNLATRWDFTGFDIANGVATKMIIPTLPAKTTGVSFFAGFSPDLSGGFTPETTSKDNMQILGNLATAQKATKAAQQSAFDAALRIENPAMHSPNTIDCASCHVAGPSAVETGGKLGITASGNANAFARDAKFLSASDVKQTTPIKTGDRNFHAFSYRNDAAMISMRVINETASVVAYLNGNVLGAAKE